MGMIPFGWILFGAAAAFVAKYLLPRSQTGLMRLCLLGITGSILGGLTATLIGLPTSDLGSLIAAMIGAVSLTRFSDDIWRKPKPSAQHHSLEQPASKPSLEHQKILFISYRRSDSLDVTGRIYDQLESHFGRQSIFKDVDSILPGADFRQEIQRTVATCSVMLAVIGRDWLGRKNNKRSTFSNKIQDPEDFVRIEVEAGLNRNIPVIPILVQGADMPSEKDLPSSLRELSYRNWISVRPDPDFHRDLERLIKALEIYLK
jgi:uncharacterized membrane protein YeaQ/YmgE (transglycosylase-associated protein family)